MPTEAAVNHLWWERAYTYPAPAGPAAWFEAMALIRAPYAGPQREGQMSQLESYPIDPDGYVHTWGGSVGWPFPASPPYDTRHFDTNARFILACWRYYLWTGNKAFLKSQAERLQSAMRYQLVTLHGQDGLIVTASKDVTGRHKGIGDNYWDILPFGHLDAYANAAYYGSLAAMIDIDAALRLTPLTDYAKLQEKAHRAYDATFWDNARGRYIGCVDIDGKRHDYGFTFVNLEALFYGLGDADKARRIYHWMETEPTSSGKADTYTRWIFAPRSNTIHDPQWGPGAPAADLHDPVPPWWMFGWHGTPYGDQCQDGGAILYLSYFDLMDRLRYFGIGNAWERFSQIMARYQLPDHLCGGAPLYLGEQPQQENPGSVGTDLPFPESGLVPAFFLYGVLGIQAEADGLHVSPRLPAELPSAGVEYLGWHGRRLRIQVNAHSVRVAGFSGAGRPETLTLPLKPGVGAVITERELASR
jgi:hypothetical protein